MTMKKCKSTLVFGDDYGNSLYQVVWGKWYIHREIERLSKKKESKASRESGKLDGCQD